MPEKYVKRTNFWENLTPLDSSHLKVFLEIFHFFWIQIWILNLGRFGTGPNRNRVDSHRFGEPWCKVASSEVQRGKITRFRMKFEKLFLCPCSYFVSSATVICPHSFKFCEFTFYFSQVRFCTWSLCNYLYFDCWRGVKWHRLVNNKMSTTTNAQLKLFLAVHSADSRRGIYSPFNFIYRA